MNKAASTITKIEAALVTETRPWVTRRLNAVVMVLGGRKQADVARELGASEPSISAWMRIVKTSGWRAITRHGKSETCRRELNLAQLQPDIQAALQHETNPLIRKRLGAVDRLLAGEPGAHVARDMDVTPHALRYWLRRLQREGIAALTGPKQSRRRI